MALTEEQLQAFRELEAALGAQDPRPGNADPGDGTDWRGGTRAFAQGLTMGYADELSAAIGAGFAKATGDPAPYGDIYRDIRDAERAEQEAFAAESPMANVGLQAGGALAGALLTGGATAGTRAAATLQSMGAVPRALTVGGAAGAVEGLGRSEADLTRGDIEGAAADVGTGAVLGAATGGVTQAGMDLLGRGFSAVGNRLFAGSRTRAQSAVDAALQREGVAPEDILRQVEQMGPGGMPAFTPELESVARLTARPRIRAAFEDMLTSQRDDVLEVADDIARQRGIDPSSFNRSRRKLVEAQRTAAREQYQAVHGRTDIPTVGHPELAELMGRPSVKKAYEAARKLSQDEGTPLPRLLDMRGSDDPMDWVWKEVPGWKEWDYIQRGLRMNAEKTYRQALTGAATKNEARILRELRREVLGYLDDLSPDFQKARSTYAGMQATIDAMDYGRDVLKPSIDVEDLADVMADMGEAERLGMATGLMKALRTKMANTRESANLQKAIANTPGQQEKLALVLGPAGADAVLGELERTGRQLSSASRIALGSETAPQAAAQEALGMGADRSVVDQLMQGNIGGAARAAGNAVLPPGLTPDVQAEIGRAMVDPDRFRELMANRPYFFGAPPGPQPPQLPVANIWGATLGPVIGQELFR